MVEDKFEDYYDTLKTVLSEPAPCDGCIHAKRCKEEEVACRLFAMYVETSRFPKDFEPIYRHPTKELFVRIFTNDETLPKELRETARKEAEEKRKNEFNNGGL
jgi:hypothetical protein